MQNSKERPPAKLSEKSKKKEVGAATAAATDACTSVEMVKFTSDDYYPQKSRTWS